MVYRPNVRTARDHHPAHFAGVLAAFVLMFLSACSGQLPPVVPGTPSLPHSAATASAGTLAPTAPAPDAALLDLPPAFRYEVTLRSVQAGADPTVITGQYRDGAWAQTSRTGGQPGEELIVVRDAATGRLNSYTRAAGDSDWTRWPGVTFDAAYGLASPFTVLRLLPLATRSAAPAGTPVASGETQSQALFSTEVVQRLLTAGVDAAGPNDDARVALEQQIAPFFVPQTVTYALDPSGKVLRAAATLLSLGPDNQPAPWVELTAAYSAYDDPAIAVAAPTNAVDIADVAGKDAIAEQASEVRPGVTLRVRVFASPGVPATDSVVAVYAAGKKTATSQQPGPDAQFELKPGQYDVLVSSGGAQQWLKGVAVTQGALTSNDVLFDFAQLTVSVALNGAPVAVDVVAYPAGRQEFAGFVSENPAHFRLPAGTYDVEVAAQDGRARKRVPGVEVRAGLETTLALDLARP